eukprot:gene5278-6571_t
MKIVIFALGTRGDVQPPCVLGHELKSRGHQVRVVAEQRLKYIVDQYQLDFFEMKGDGAGILVREDVLKKLDEGDYKYALDERLKMDVSMPERLECLNKATEGMDLIISCSLTITEAHYLGLKYNIPNVLLNLQPSMPTKDYPNPMIFLTNFYFGFLNRLSYTLFSFFYGKYDKVRLNHWFKSTMGIDSNQLPWDFLNFVWNDNQVVISVVDPVIFPTKSVPTDYLKDWHVTGFLFPKQINFNPIPEKVLRFMEDTQHPPVVFGLGSMTLSSNQDLLNMVIKVVTQRCNQRLIVISSWSKYKDFQETDKMIMVENVDHGYLFPKSKLIIHHGGVGSTAAVLKSGTPSIVTHLYADQPFFGQRIQDLGVGKSLKLKTLTESQLFTAMYEILSNPLYKQKALEISDIINSTDSSKLSADIIEDTYKKFNNKI